MTLLERFLKYTRIVTFSDSSVSKVPSTDSQKVLAEELVTELESLGLDVSYDREHCYIYGALKGNREAPKLGFLAHLDTSEDAKGEAVNPQVFASYQGGDLILSEGKVLKVSENPDLNNHIGKTLITSDGKSLLGADDKAGIAEIMGMLEYFRNNPGHGDIYVCFTPDEEIGRAINFFDKSKFPVDYAYTVDGLDLGEISYENFNAASVIIDVKGVASHLGQAKGKLINALSIAHKLNFLVPDEVPENTEGREGYYHLLNVNGDFTNVKMVYLIRDFDKVNFQKRKEKFRLIVERLREEYGDLIDLKIVDAYFNMKDIIDKDFHLVSNARESMKNMGIMPKEELTRGGTDGARLSYMGIPCPNIGTGAHNIHSIYEYIALEDMEKVREILIGIVNSYSRSENLGRNRTKKS